MNGKRTVLDLFSGCGGLSYGFMQAGYSVIAGIDNWDTSLQTFKLNHPSAKTITADISKLPPEKAAKQLGIKRNGVTIIVGGPPCQGFSLSGKRNIDDPRNQLYRSFVRYVDYFRPAAFIMENVPNILAMANGTVKNRILSDFKRLGYEITYKVLLASDYGVPQNRKRAVFVGLQNGMSFSFPNPTHGEGASLKPKVTTRDAISDLPNHGLSDGNSYSSQVQSEYQLRMRKHSNGIFNHQVMEHTQQTKKIISLVPDGGNYKDLPERFRQTRRVHIAWTRFNSQKPSATIDTGHRHHFHYKFHRIPTARESARLQSFPDDFIFLGSKTSQYKQIGNAVPPIMAEQLARALTKALNKK